MSNKILTECIFQKKKLGNFEKINKIQIKIKIFQTVLKLFYT